MKSLSINIPDNVEFSEKEAQMLLASRLFEKGKLSIVEAAELVGMSKLAFLEILPDYRISPTDLTNKFTDKE